MFNLLERVSNGLIGTAGSSSSTDNNSLMTTTAAAATPSHNNQPTAGDATAIHRLGVGELRHYK